MRSTVALFDGTAVEVPGYLATVDVDPASPLVDTVRQATAAFKEVQAADAAGSRLMHGCVSGQQDGAMGLHVAHGALVGDGALDAQRPEALLYESRGGQLQLLGVESIVMAEAWDANHPAPPVMHGHLFNATGRPIRFRLPPLYEVHVWAWETNPRGTFADWNPRVSCAEVAGDAPMSRSDHN